MSNNLNTEEKTLLAEQLYDIVEKKTKEYYHYRYLTQKDFQLPHEQRNKNWYLEHWDLCARILKHDIEVLTNIITKLELKDE